MASEQLKTIIEILRTRPVQAELSIEERRSELEAAFTQFQTAADVQCDPVDAGGVPAPSGSLLPERCRSGPSIICTVVAM